jgi:lysozyme family protein
MNFSDMADLIIDRIEKGYSNDRRDNGGETKWGISVRAHPHLAGRIRDLTRDEAKAIYYSDYYVPAKLHQMPERLRLPVFDAAINHGVKRSAEFVQRALKKLGFKLEVDAVIGPVTLAAIEKADTLDFITAYTRVRQGFFRQLQDYGWAGESWEKRAILVAAAS